MSVSRQNGSVNPEVQFREEANRECGPGVDLKIIAAIKARQEQRMAHYAALRGESPPPAAATDLVSVADAAEVLGISHKKIWHWIEGERIRRWGSAKHYRVSLTEVRRHVNGDGVGDYLIRTLCGRTGGAR